LNKISITQKLIENYDLIGEIEFKKIDK